MSIIHFTSSVAPSVGNPQFPIKLDFHDTSSSGPGEDFHMKGSLGWCSLEPQVFSAGAWAIPTLRFNHTGLGGLLTSRDVDQIGYDVPSNPKWSGRDENWDGSDVVLCMQYTFMYSTLLIICILVLCTLKALDVYSYLYIFLYCFLLVIWIFIVIPIIHTVYIHMMGVIMNGFHISPSPFTKMWCKNIGWCCLNMFAPSLSGWFNPINHPSVFFSCRHACVTRQSCSRSIPASCPTLWMT